MRTLRFAVWVPCCFMAAGCDGREGVDLFVQVDTLPGGAVHVSNPETGAWGDSSAWRLAEDLRIGSVEGDEPDSFGAVHALEVDAYGRIYVLDRLAREVVVFNPEGHHVRTIGAEGSGPGELSRPSGFAWMPEWQLWVEDQGNQRFTVFDTTGTLLETHSRDFIWLGFRWAGGFDREGGRYGLGSRHVGRRAEDVLLRLNESGGPVDTIPLPFLEPLVFEILENGVPVRGGAVPFAPSLFWRLDPNGVLWFGRSDELRLVQLDPTGDTLRVVERRGVLPRVTAAEKDEALAAEYLEPFHEAGVVDRAMVPDLRALWRGLAVDDDGHLWVIRDDPDGESVAFDVFDPQGIYLGRLPFDVPNMQISPAPVIRFDHLYVVVQDEWGVQFIVRARIDRSDE